MYLLYNLILLTVAIAFLPVILIAFIIQPKFRAGFWQKLGFYKLTLANKPTIWFHAVSVGEVNAIESLVKKTKQELQDHNIVVSTVTRTGQEVANKKLKDTVDEIIYFPYDFFFSVLSAIKAINPQIVVIAETEIWPSFAHILKINKVPLMIVNGRISPSSYKGYKKFSFFFKKILANYTSILMQTQSDKDRIVDIGANPSKTEVMGNLKFDITKTLTSEEINSLAASLNLNGEKVLIAGSTHKGEDEIVLNVFERLKDEFEDLKLILAPRHPERHAQVIELLEHTASDYGLRSKNDTLDVNDILLLDTMGELGKIYSICHMAFIGGSFSNTGGHNPLEATIYNKPTISGNIVFNFKDIYSILTTENASYLVESEDNLYEKCKTLLENNDEYKESIESCKDVFKQNSGALNYAVDKIKNILKL